MPNGDIRHGRGEGDLSDPRWRGVVDTRLDAVEDWVRDLDRKQEDAGKETSKEITKLRVQVAQLHTKVGVWSAVGGLVGAGVIAFVAKLLGAH